jgi:hypothetical protein
MDYARRKIALGLAENQLAEGAGAPMLREGRAWRDDIRRRCFILPQPTYALDSFNWDMFDMGE